MEYLGITLLLVGMCGMDSEDKGLVLAIALIICGLAIELAQLVKERKAK